MGLRLFPRALHARTNNGNGTKATATKGNGMKHKLWKYLCYRKLLLLFYALSILLMLLVALLSNSFSWTFGYAMLLISALLLFILGLDFLRFCRKINALYELSVQTSRYRQDLPAPTNPMEALYSNVVELLYKAIAEDRETLSARYEESLSYYTLWIHQIKTPIAAMRLTLQGEDTPAARRLMTELGRVEQYVDMALTYLRLEEGGSDYVIRTCAVDDVVRAAVRRFAGEFIDRRIALDYTPVEWETVTDGKWLTFVVEQLLSNALKYTGQDGTVRIYREGDDLCIRDSGMGIAPEDLPRVFDMGYTGQNGRLDRRSSGIGLYLCRRICRNLRHEIRIESVPGVGTTVRLTLGRPAFVAE